MWMTEISATNIVQASAALSPYLSEIGLVFEVWNA
jgi:hypothetical protein